MLRAARGRRGEILARQLRRRDRRQDARLQRSAQLTPGDHRTGCRWFVPGGRCGLDMGSCTLRTVDAGEILARQLRRRDRRPGRPSAGIRAAAAWRSSRRRPSVRSRRPLRAAASCAPSEAGRSLPGVPAARSKPGRPSAGIRAAAAWRSTRRCPSVRSRRPLRAGCELRTV